ncbi:unnamed protein product [Symbiodinium sp. CCMP2456]|nr:unnamed protein product [Symbiodinium sp. CCMP2456]
MAKRLGGASGRPGKALDREERLEKLVNSCAFGGAPVPVPEKGKRAVGPKSLGLGRPASAGASHGVRAISQGRGKPPPANAPPKPGSNIHTLASLGESGSRLQDTTEAYRQQRGTTAKKVTDVGYQSMTAEKAAEVDKARAKARVNSHRSASVPTNAKVFSVSGQQISQRPGKRVGDRGQQPGAL